MFQILRDISPVAVLMFDREGVLVLINRRWTEFTGQLEATALGSGWIIVIEAQERDSFVSQFMDAVGHGSECLARIAIVSNISNTDSESLPSFCFHSVPHRDTNGNLLGFVATVSKYESVILSNQLQAKGPSDGRISSESLTLAKKVARDVAAAKAEFLGNISHELRTPLNGIVGVADLLTDTNLTAEQREYLTILKGCSGTLLNLVNDLLDYSSLDSIKRGLTEVEFHLSDSIAGLMRVLDMQARAKNQELVSFIEEYVPDLLFGDVSRLKQVLSNILGNAIKFTLPGGGILLIGSVHSVDAESTTLRFSIADSGIGIPEQLLGKVFEPFTQVDGSYTRKEGGVGLGLSLSSSLVNLMGGRIWCESKEGVGSTFHFTARFKVVDSKPRRPFAESEELSPGLRVLVVQPNQVAVEHIAMILKKWRLLPTGLHLGRDAERELSAGLQRNEKFDVIILDAVLPDGDGFSVAHHLKTIDPKVRVLLLLSTDNYYEGLRRVKEQGLDGAILKPVTHSTLLDALMSLYSAERPGVSAVDQADALLSRGWLSSWEPDVRMAHETSKIQENQSALSILVVEDNFANQRVVSSLLEKQGYKVFVAWNGSEACTALENNDYDLVLMDSNLPHISGLEVIRRVRIQEAASGKHTPILSITANVADGHRESCLAAGADGYISKPFSNEKLVEMVKRTIEQFSKKEQRRVD